jgi:hypothetical protein
MSTTRSLLALAAAALALSCGGEEADLTINLSRATHEGGAMLYVCGMAVNTPCKPVEAFKADDGRDTADIGVYVHDDSVRLDLQLQLSAPPSCGHFSIDFSKDRVVDVALSPSATDAFTVSNCQSCLRQVAPCDYPARL